MSDRLKNMMLNKDQKQESVSSNNNPNYPNVSIQNLSNEYDQLFISKKATN